MWINCYASDLVVKLLGLVGVLACNGSDSVAVMPRDFWLSSMDLELGSLIFKSLGDLIWSNQCRLTSSSMDSSKRVMLVALLKVWSSYVLGFLRKFNFVVTAQSNPVFTGCFHRLSNVLACFILSAYCVILSFCVKFSLVLCVFSLLLGPTLEKKLFSF